MKLLSSDFFARPTLDVARALLGRLLVRDDAPGRRVGMIVETEGYTQNDPAFRGWGAVLDSTTDLVLPNRRTADLFGKPGTAYVYLCYNHWLLNVVTEPEGVAGAVLIRAVEPLDGIAAMWANRPTARTERDLASGPGKLTQALDVDGRFHNQPLTAPPLFFAEPDELPEIQVATSSRIGLSFGTDRPYRFFVANSPFVSPGVPSDLAAARSRDRRHR